MSAVSTMTTVCTAAVAPAAPVASIRLRPVPGPAVPTFTAGSTNRIPAIAAASAAPAGATRRGTAFAAVAARAACAAMTACCMSAVPPGPAVPAVSEGRGPMTTVAAGAARTAYRQRPITARIVRRLTVSSGFPIAPILARAIHPI